MHSSHARLHALTLLALAAALLMACARRPAPSPDARSAQSKTTGATSPNTASAMPVTWFSVPADDIEKATSFYHQAFGWKIEPLTKEADEVYDYNVVVSSPSDHDFTPSQPGRVNGCIVKRAIGLPAPAVLIEVPDLDDAARKVVAAGGTVVSKKVAMRSLNGEFILVKDPDGNVLELFKANAP